MSNWADTTVKPKSKSKTAPKRAKYSSDADSTVRGLWGRYTGGGWFDENLRRAGQPDAHGFFDYSAKQQAQTQRMVEAGKIVQNFMNALSGRERFVVTIEDIPTAYTDMKDHKTGISAAILTDEVLSAIEAGGLMTGFVAHEIGHARFDENVYNVLQQDSTLVQYNASILLNYLRENRVEKGFEDAFPGFRGIFEPVHRYISRDITGMPEAEYGINFVLAATRFPFRYTWSDPRKIEERDWWIAWAERGMSDDPAVIKQAVLDGLDRLQNVMPKNGETAAMKAEKRLNELQDKVNGKIRERHDKYWEMRSEKDPDELEKRREEYRKLGDEIDSLKDSLKGAKSTRTRERNKQQNMPQSVEDYRNKAAAKKAQSNATQQSIAAANGQLGADRIIVMVGNPPSRGESNDLHDETVSPVASAIFRSAFQRLRGVSVGEVRSLKRGRLDDRRLDRLAGRDDRVFSRPKEGTGRQHLNIYLMVDCSGSMLHEVRNMRRLVMSLVDSVRSVGHVRLHVYGWDSLIWPVVMPGEPPEKARFGIVARGQTEDAATIAWAAQDLLRTTNPDEKPVILCFSDGEGNNGPAPLAREIEKARRQGITVYGLASGNVNLSDRYGPDAWTSWKGSIEQTAEPLARILASEIKGGSR